MVIFTFGYFCKIVFIFAMVCGDGPLKITLIGTRVKVVYCGYLHLLCSHHILLLIGSVWFNFAQIKTL